MQCGANVNCWKDEFFQLFQHIVDYTTCVRKEGLTQCFMATDPLVSSCHFLILVILYSFVWSIVGQNCSKVDQIWSLVPFMYCWIFLLHHMLVNDLIIHIRLGVMALLMTLWGVRLTYNFWRKGGYGNFFTHEEDYRWPILRAKMHPIAFFFFNLTFIATYQNVLLYLIAFPAYFVMKGPANEFTQFDALLTVLFLLLLTLESIADEHHFQFQTLKYSFPLSARNHHSMKDIREGFYQSGLWSYSRHPNYFAEQSMWICIYGFVVVTTGQYFHPSIIGCALLVMLFHFSMEFSESITKSKYPAYAAYQSKVSRCLPWFPAATTTDKKVK